jgi:hypothetical protein
MSKNRSSALKRDREARKSEKRALKQQRREERKLDIQSGGVTGDSGTPDAAEFSDTPQAEAEPTPGVDSPPPQT